MSQGTARRRGRRRPLAIAGVVALAFSAALAPQASASLAAPPPPPPGPLDLGVYIFGEPFNELELGRLRAGGGEVIRSTFQWSNVQRTSLSLYD